MCVVKCVTYTNIQNPESRTGIDDGIILARWR